MARRTVSYRLSLVVAIPLLIVATGLLIAVSSYVTTKRSVDALRTQLFEQVGKAAADEARSHVAQAVPAVDLVTVLLHDAQLPTDITGDDELLQTLIGVLRANPGFAWVSFSDVRGSFVGVQRTGLQVLANRSRIVDGKTDLVEQTVNDDGTLRPLRHTSDTHYDPRTRPFYVRATAKGSRVWTPPYLFVDLSGTPPAGTELAQGITCAAPVYARDGSLSGVVTVDFDLDALSRFVSSIHLSPHAVVFLYTADGVILAHPTLRVTSPSGAGAELLTTKNTSDPLLAAFFQGSESAEFDVAFRGEPYVAASRPFSIDTQLDWRVGAIAPESDFLGPLRANARNALLVSLGAMILAVILGWTLARELAKPLAVISSEMERAGRFEIGEHVPMSTSFTEIATMDRALGAMKSGLRSFGAYVPKDLVRAVLASGARAELGGKTKRLTVFFSDLAGFTTLSETLSPDALVELLGGYFDEMTKVIQARGGTIDKFIGDAIMAFWNAPLDEPAHATLACEAALACQQKLEEMRRRDPRLATLHARIGLATGDVLVGNIGASDRMNYTVMGDTANLASRLEGLNKAYGTPVMMSEGTYDAVMKDVVARPIDVVAVKGKLTGIRVFEPLAMEASASPSDRLVVRASARALDAYLARDFAAAEAAWAEVLGARPGDSAATTMKARAAEYRVSPPPPNWDGTHVMHEK